MDNTFFYKYTNNIQKKIEQIDIFMKSEPPPFRYEDICKLLDIPVAKLHTILQEIGTPDINDYVLYNIMLKADSYICELLRRELERGTPYTYSADDIGYIYGLDAEKIEDIRVKLGIQEITSSNLGYIFKYI